MKLLIIEDNTMLVKSLRDILSKQYLIDSARTGADGIEHATTEEYDAIILDLALPDMNGQEVCETLRRQKITIPILIVTAVSDVDTKIKLLENGADDYITKPFSVGELQARLRALLRREPAVSPSLIVVGKLVIDPLSRRVEREGQEIKLRRKEFDILEYLARNRGKIVTRQMIIDHVWEAGQDRWNNTVDVHVKYLRDKIDRPFATKLIKTAYGIGYVIDEPHKKHPRDIP